MKTIKEVFNFSNEYTFCDDYDFDRVLELNRVRQFIMNVLSKVMLIIVSKRWY